MKGMLKLTCLTMLLALGSACEKSNYSGVASVSYGTSFGMCVGYCVNNLVITNETVTFTKSKNGSNPETKTCTSAISTTDVNVMKDLINTAEVAKLPETIGCPDCADGGAEWVAITHNGKVQKVVFEYGKAPAALTQVVVKFRALKESFKNCN